MIIIQKRLEQYIFSFAVDLVESENNNVEKIVNDLIRFIRSFDGIYFDGFFDKTIDEKVIIYHVGFLVKNEKLKKILSDKLNNTITNNQLEHIMSSKQAPYKLWTLTSLKNECKQRKIDISKLMKVKNKMVFVELLMADDQPTTKKESSKVKPKAKPKAKPIDDELEDELDDDELEDELDDEELEDEKPKPKSKLKVKPKAKPIDDELEDDELEDDELEDEKEKEKLPKKKRAPRIVKLNVKLKEKKLWRSGCQFLSSEEKQQLLSAKNKAECEVVYKILEKKMKKISKVLSK